MAVVTIWQHLCEEFGEDRVKAWARSRDEDADVEEAYRLAVSYCRELYEVAGVEWALAPRVTRGGGGA